MRSHHALTLCAALCSALFAGVAPVTATSEPVLAEGLNLTPFLGRLTTCEAPWTAHDGACTCPPGWTVHSVYTCAPCAAGFFKEEPGFHACTACPGPTTSFGGAVEASECLCSEGHAELGGACAPCPAGTYKSFVGNNTCVPCPSAARTAEAGAVAISACVCPAGHVLGEAGCEPCPVNFGSDPAGGDCRPCEAHSGTDAPGAACECDAGYAPGVPEAPGAPGDTAPCSACPEGKYKSGRGQRPCAECPANTLSPAGSTGPEQCLCAPGFELSEHEGCVTCAENAFCPGRGQKQACPEHSTSPAGSAAGSDCACLPGFFSYDNRCLECGEGFFCAGGVRKQCPPHSTSERGSSSVENCTCVSGFVSPA